MRFGYAGRSRGIVAGFNGDFAILRQVVVQEYEGLALLVISTRDNVPDAVCVRIYCDRI